MSGSLCDAVTGQEGGSARLEALHRGNFFLVPLDEQRHWYRYHHLFADVLQTHLRAEQPERVATLHRRASAWHEQHGSPADAIRHALAGEDFAHAADLVELAIPAQKGLAFEVCDVHGKSITRNDLNEGTKIFTVSCEGLVDGLYVLRIGSARSDISVHKLIKASDSKGP